jgi:NDP-4-keto-2,6-dideoxyhexose 3-C-methyltransferase
MKTRSTCRVCDSSIEPILSLGMQYVSNFLSPEQPDGPTAPLELVLCSQCRLLQLKHTVPAEDMYKNYWYRSGTNQSMQNALTDIARKAEELIHLSSGDSVLDIGCNDGTLLSSYRTRGIYKVGFDPAENLAVFSWKSADKVMVGFFDADAFLKDTDLQSIRPKIVTSIAMFYDLEDPNRFVADIKRVMHPQGLWIVQMSYLPLMLKQNDFGNICHEHLEYYSLQAFEFLLKRHDFVLADVELNDVNGGSFRAYIRNRDADLTVFGDAAYRQQAIDRVRALRAKEAEMKLDQLKPYREFADRVQQIRREVSNFVKEQVRHNKKVYVYGASTKGNTMLQYFGLDSTLISAAAERNPDKWGKVTVGTRIPIVSEAAARAAKPDYFLVLPWHFIEEFTARERDYLSCVGKFIVPLPQFSIIPA